MMQSFYFSEPDWMFRRRYQGEENMASYTAVKKAVIDVVDDFSQLDIVAGYGSTYSAKTKLEKIGLSSPVLAVMPPRFNKRLGALVGTTWRNVAPSTLVGKTTIGDLILLACGQSGTVVPFGEPT